MKAKIPNPKDLEGKLAHGGAHSQVFFKTNTKLVDDKGRDKVFYKSLKLLTKNENVCFDVNLSERAERGQHDDNDEQLQQHVRYF